MALSRICGLIGALLFASAAPAQEKAEAADLSNLVSNDDYPLEAMVAGEKGAVVMAVRIDGEGRVLSCTIKQSAGAALDKASCQAVRRRQFTATAKRLSGRPATIEAELKWFLEDSSDGHRIPLGPFGTIAVHQLVNGAVLSCREDVSKGVIQLMQICKATNQQAVVVAGRFPNARSLVFDFSGVQGDHQYDVNVGEGDGESLVRREVKILTIDSKGDVIGCEMVEAARSPEEQRKECALVAKHQRYEPSLAGSEPRFATEIRAAYVTDEVR